MATLDDLIAYDQANPHQTYRLNLGARKHVGYLSVQTTHKPGGEDRTAVRVRDNRRAPRSQYASVFERTLDEGRLEVKIGSRFVPFPADGSVEANR